MFGTSLCCLLGICGAAACSVAMFAVPLGLVGAGVAVGAKAGTASGMAGMSRASGAIPAWVTLLSRYGPELLAVSLLLVVAALVVRRSMAGAGAALIGGIVLFYGMYGQANVSVMWLATIAGLLLLLASPFGLHPLGRAAPRR